MEIVFGANDSTSTWVFPKVSDFDAEDQTITFCFYKEASEMFYDFMQVLGRPSPCLFFNEATLPSWFETGPTSCSVVDSLVCEGFLPLEGQIDQEVPELAEHVPDIKCSIRPRELGAQGLGDAP